MKPTSLLMVLMAALGAAGCSLMPQVRPFDGVEYDYAVRTVTVATRAVHQCPDVQGEAFQARLQELNVLTMHLHEYERWRPMNEDVLTATATLRGLVKGAVAADSPTLRYCQPQAV